MKRLIYQMAAAMLILSMCFTNPAFAFQGGSLAQGTFTVYKNGKIFEKLTGQNPVEEGALLDCNSQCLFKSKGIALVASINTRLALKDEADTYSIYLEKGYVDFVITDNTRKFAVHTADGVYTVADVIFDASSQTVVRGYIAINKEGKTEVGVREGRMVFATANGTQTVNPDNRIILAIGDVPNQGGGDFFGGGLGGAFLKGGLIFGTSAGLMFIEQNSNGSTNQ